MQWHKEMLRGFRDNAAYEAGRYLILGVAAAVWPIINGILHVYGAKPWYWKLNGGLMVLATLLLLAAVTKLIFGKRKTHPAEQPLSQALERRRRAILTKVVDRLRNYTTHISQVIGHPPVTRIEGKADPIGALVELCEEFEEEEDVVWVCKRLDEDTDWVDPFRFYELKYGCDAFEGKRLKFLRSARIKSGPRILNDNDALLFIDVGWGQRNKVAERDAGSFPGRS